MTSHIVTWRLFGVACMFGRFRVYRFGEQSNRQGAKEIGRFPVYCEKTFTPRRYAATKIENKHFTTKVAKSTK